MATQRHLILALGCFAVLLALANMGTAFAAAYLAKDTEITAGGELASKDTHERVATTAKGYICFQSGQACPQPERGRWIRTTETGPRTNVRHAPSGSTGCAARTASVVNFPVLSDPSRRSPTPMLSGRD
mmetsp:Transcript_3879/g.9080  ORF Transcript_3879/g.9080 Transcript_3879/m.9080 type:complete len:129 (+) Transcript_3879:763-1149(+)